MHSSPTLLARVLEPLVAGSWVLFVITSLLVGTVWAFGIGDADLALWVGSRDLLAALQWLLPQLDFLWIALAAVNGYLCLTARHGLPTARRWSLTILLAVTALGWMSARTGFPLGPIEYGLPLGPIQVWGLRVSRFGPVPLGLPLFWFSALIGAREGLLWVFPRFSHLQVAIGTGLVALLTDVSLEPLAAKLRGFWFWRSGSPNLPPSFDAPLWSCLVWGLLGSLVAFFLRETKIVAKPDSRSWQPAVTLGVFYVVFIAAHIGRWMRI